MAKSKSRMQPQKNNKILRFALAIVMAVAMVMAAPTAAGAEEAAASGGCSANGSNVTWALDNEGTLTISGEGEMKNYRFFFYFGSGSPWSKSSYIKEIVINEGVTSIGTGAFPYCSALTSVKLPHSLTSIGQFAFYDCSSLEDVYYNGTKEEWEKISSNDHLNDATIHFNSTGSDDEPNVKSIPYLDMLTGTDPTVYNNELAIIAANLSKKTYDNDFANDESVRGYLQYNLGFDEAHHATFFSNNYGGSLAYTVATKDYGGSGADKLLVIACQGTTNLYEMTKDATAGTKSSYKGYQVYDIIHDFYTDIVETGLPHVMESDKTYKVLLTGHSLGGAAANLLGASMTDSATDKSNIFCYTFGSVNCIRSDYRIETGYENIHNIYNWLDTFSPKQYGGWLLTGMGTGNGKFGRLEAFYHEYRSAANIYFVSDPMKQILAHINHDMDNYLDAVENGYVSGPTTVDGETDLIDTYAMIACPVDIEIVNSRQVAARVVNNDVETAASNIHIWVQDDVKYIMLPSTERFDITILSTGDGSMNYFVERFHGDQVTYRAFTAVQLVAGKIMTSTIGGDIETEDVKLYVMDEDNTPHAEVQTDGTETPIAYAATAVDGTVTPIEYTVTVVDGTATPIKAKPGDTITVTANDKSGFTFKEWGTIGTVTLVDKTKSTTTFTMPSEDVTIIASYTKNLDVSALITPLIIVIGSRILIGCFILAFLLWKRQKHNAY
ncbi:MAG: leucine-rich repeat protein [Clostridia bacterium]|nr:leucine-rich repeat protein [Clostridia bacterium]